MGMGIPIIAVVLAGGHYSAVKARRAARYDVGRFQVVTDGSRFRQITAATTTIGALCGVLALSAHFENGERRLAAPKPWISPFNGEVIAIRDGWSVSNVDGAPNTYQFVALNGSKLVVISRDWANSDVSIESYANDIERSIPPHVQLSGDWTTQKKHMVSGLQIEGRYKDDDLPVRYFVYKVGDEIWQLTVLRPDKRKTADDTENRLLDALIRSTRQRQV